MKVLKNDVVYEVMPGYEWFWKNFTNDTWEPHTFKIFDRYLSPDHAFLDIGAWIGPTALYASQVAKEVIAYEPDPVAFMFLEKNIQMNNIFNIKAEQKAIAYDGFLLIGRKDKFGDSMSGEMWTKDRIKVDSISLMRAIQAYKPNFIKMDIEGGEFTALPPAKQTLEEYKPTIYLSLHTPWFANKEEYLDAICDVLSIYPKLLDEWMNPVTLEDIRNFIGFRSIIATYE